MNKGPWNSAKAGPTALESIVAGLLALGVYLPVVYRMAETGLTRMPVVERESPQQLLGMISLSDLLRARTRDLEEERRRERHLRLRFPFRRGVSEADGASAERRDRPA